MADLSTSYMGLKLRNPIIAGSSGLTHNIESIKEIYRQGAGAIILKSLFEEQINEGISRSVIMGEDVYSYPEAQDYIHNHKRANVLENYIQLIRDAKAAVDIPIIASINCVSLSEWVSFAKNIQDAGADGLELNLFILPSDPRRKADQQEQVYFEILQSVMKQVKIPVAAKVSYYFSGMTNMALQLSWTGIAGLVLFNRFYTPDIDIDTFEIVPGHIFSTPAEMAQTLRWVALLSDKVQCDIAASTGIHDAGAAIKQMLAGAKAVQVVSVLYQKGPGQIALMLKEMETWMESHHFASTKDFTGKMSFRETSNPAAYERVQFIKHFAGIE
jgi:dihydroorotate dehydrogenase (fumarate)